MIDLLLVTQLKFVYEIRLNKSDKFGNTPTSFSDSSSQINTYALRTFSLENHCWSNLIKLPYIISVSIDHKARQVNHIVWRMSWRRFESSFYKQHFNHTQAIVKSLKENGWFTQKIKMQFFVFTLNRFQVMISRLQSMVINFV